jgi:hypothetical protein
LIRTSGLECAAGIKSPSLQQTIDCKQAIEEIEQTTGPGRSSYSRIAEEIKEAGETLPKRKPT